MERKLNSSWFAKRLQKHDTYSTLSTTQYWDWLTYIDVSKARLTKFRMTISQNSRY